MFNEGPDMEPFIGAICARAIEAKRQLDNIDNGKCPKCKSENTVMTGSSDIIEDDYYDCKDCGHHFGVRKTKEL